MIKRLVFLSFLFLIFISPSSAFSQQPVHLIQLEDDTINPITAEYIINSIHQAETDRAQALVIKLDTPGGLLNSTRKIVKSIMGADVPVVVYIAPGGSRAGSAGVFITYASHVAAMAPSTNIGAAHPVQLGEQKGRSNMWDDLKEMVKDGDGEADEDAKEDSGEAVAEKADETEGAEEAEETQPEEPVFEEDQDPMSSKILNDTVAFIKSIAEKRGRNVEWAIKSVVESASITEVDALEQNVVEIIAVDDRDLLNQLDGREVMIDDRPVILNTADAAIEKIGMSERQKFFNILANPNIAYILMILGFYGLLYEITNPGIGVPGIAGMIFLILAFFSMQTLPTNYAGLALVVLGLLLFTAEAFIPGFGLPTLGGIVSLILGSLLLFDSPEPFMRVSLSIIIPFAVVTAGITIFLVRMVIKAHLRTAFSGAEGMIGSKGQARADMSAGVQGRVFVHGEIWNAVAEENINKGDAVIVTKMDGLLLTVKKV